MNSKIAVKKIPAKAVYIIPKQKMDIENFKNKIGSEDDKKEKGKVQFQGYKKAPNTMVAKTIKRGNALPKLKLGKRMRDRKFRKYFFNEDSEEETVSSDGEKQVDKCKPRITNV